MRMELAQRLIDLTQQLDKQMRSKATTTLGAYAVLGLLSAYISDETAEKVLKDIETSIQTSKEEQS